MGKKYTCPECNKNALYVTPHNGLSYCFACGYTHIDREYRSTYTYKPKKIRGAEEIRQIRSFYTRIARYYHSCLETSHRDWLYSRGFTDESIEKYLIGYVPEDANNLLYNDPACAMSGLKTFEGKAFLHGRISFPYIHKGKVTDIRARSLDKEAALRYLSPIGSSASRGSLWPWQYEYDTSNQGQSIIITEGEIAAGISTQHGFPALGLPGINANRNIAAQNVVIIFDREQNIYVKRAIVKLAKKFENPYVSTLYVPKGLRHEAKIDIDTFILAGGDMRRVLSSALPFDQWKLLQERNI